MTDAERMDKIAELAAKTGVIYVSPDIADMLMKGRAVHLAWLLGLTASASRSLNICRPIPSWRLT